VYHKTYHAHLVYVYIYVDQTLEKYFFRVNIDQLKLEIYTILYPIWRGGRVGRVWAGISYEYGRLTFPTECRFNFSQMGDVITQIIS
jgi:hypothetical protein